MDKIWGKMGKIGVVSSITEHLTRGALRNWEETAQNTHLPRLPLEALIYQLPLKWQGNLSYLSQQGCSLAQKGQAFGRLHAFGLVLELHRDGEPAMP